MQHFESGNVMTAGLSGCIRLDAVRLQLRKAALQISSTPAWNYPWLEARCEVMIMSLSLHDCLILV
jgi:hypothetical protein